MHTMHPFTSTHQSKLFLGLFLLALLVPSPGMGLSIRAPSWTEVAHKSSAIAYVRLQKRTVFRGVQGLPMTRYTFDVIEQLKGPVQQSIVLQLIGGTVGGKTVRIAGIPSFRLGKQAILCIRKDKRVATPILVALYYGVFDVSPGPKGPIVTSRGNLLPKQSLARFKRTLQQTLRKPFPRRAH
jgi:hypothetical protein